MTRRRLIFGFLLASAVLACFAGWWLASGHRMTAAQFRRVKKGMAREEVTRIVGNPPGIYTRGYVIGSPAGIWYLDYAHWLCDDGEMFVHFDDAAVATDVVVLDDITAVPPPTALERVRKWLRL